MRYLLFIFLFTGCMATGPVYYKIAGITHVKYEYIDGWYEISYYVHVGKDADYYSIYYYVDGEMLNSSVTLVKSRNAKYMIGQLEAFAIDQPEEIIIVITSYVGGEIYKHSDTKEFTINVTNELDSHKEQVAG